MDRSRAEDPRRVDSRIKASRDLAGIKEPQYFGDIMVLPLEGVPSGLFGRIGSADAEGHQALSSGITIMVNGKVSLAGKAQ